MITEKRKEQIKQYRIKNKERIAKLSKIRYDRWLKKNKENNKDYIECQREYQSKWRENNIERKRELNRKWRKNNHNKTREYDNKRHKTNIKIKLSHRIGNAIRKSLKGNKAGHHWEDLAGYTCNDLMKRLKKTIPKNYTWDDFIQGKLHIDHIIPISAFNFTKPEHPDFKKCWALKNLRLLPARENIIKGNKLLKPFQPALKLSLIS